MRGRHNLIRPLRFLGNRWTFTAIVVGLILPRCKLLASMTHLRRAWRFAQSVSSVCNNLPRLWSAICSVGSFGLIRLKASDRGRFKTPSLRNVDVTAPYMHDGSLATLDDVVAFYARGGSPNPNLDPLVAPVDLSVSEQSQLVAYLRALTSGEYARHPEGRTVLAAPRPIVAIVPLSL